jgi:hypothetical protein
MIYLCKPSEGHDFRRLIIDPIGQGKLHLVFKEAIAKRNADDTGWLIFGHCLVVSAEYKGADGATIEKFPNVFIEFHDKQWKKVDYRTKAETLVEPTPIEIYLGSLFESNDSLCNGFSGKLSLGDESTVFAVLEKLPPESHAQILAEIVDLKPIELSDEFSKLKLPETKVNSKRASYTSAQKEIDKLNDRANWLAHFLNPDNPNGISSESHQIALLLLYKPNDDGTFKESYLRNYCALILGSNSVI